MPLDKELAYFTENLPDFLRHYAGKYVLIVGDEFLGAFDTAEKAYECGVDVKGNVPMFIRKVSPDAPSASAPAMTLGFISVGP